MVEHDFTLEGTGTTAAPLKVQIRGIKSNIMQVNAQGVLADGTHYIIPKIGAMGVYPVLSEVEELYPDGGRIYRMSFHITNHQKANHIGGADILTLIIPQLNHYFLDEYGNRIRTGITFHTTRLTAAKISVAMDVYMSAKPDKAFSIIKDEPWPLQGILNNFNVSIHFLLGFSPYQLGMGKR